MARGDIGTGDAERGEGGVRRRKTVMVEEAAKSDSKMRYRKLEARDDEVRRHRRVKREEKDGKERKTVHVHGSPRVERLSLIHI